MKTYNLSQRWVRACAVLVLAGVAGCNQLPPTLVEPNLNVTQAYQTVEARLTEALARTPTVTFTPTLTMTGVETVTPVSPTATPSPTATSSTPTITATIICDQAAPGSPIDVTIPDDTQMRPGQSFTKTWRLQNVGPCTWDESYALVWFSGEQLDAPLTVPLRGAVSSGEVVDLSVDMTAPQTPGSYQSNWKLRNDAGVLFGIGPSAASSFWVRIVVLEQETETPLPAPPATDTPTPTATTSVRVSAPVSLQPADLLDLDTGEVNTADGTDLEFTAGDQVHLLQPLGSASMAVYGETQPSLSACQSITLSTDARIVEELIPGTYLCYRTNMALPGWARLVSFSPETGVLELEINTWAIP